jgi:hypothetical protein
VQLRFRADRVQLGRPRSRLQGSVLFAILLVRFRLPFAVCVLCCLSCHPRCLLLRCLFHRVVSLAAGMCNVYLVLELSVLALRYECRFYPRILLCSGLIALSCRVARVQPSRSIKRVCVVAYMSMRSLMLRRWRRGQRGDHDLAGDRDDLPLLGLPVPGLYPPHMPPCVRSPTGWLVALLGHRPCPSYTLFPLLAESKPVLLL